MTKNTPGHPHSFTGRLLLKADTIYLEIYNSHPIFFLIHGSMQPCYFNVLQCCYPLSHRTQPCWVLLVHNWGQVAGLEESKNKN